MNFVVYLLNQSDSFASPWTVDHQAALSIDFPGKNTGVDCHFLLQVNKVDKIALPWWSSYASRGRQTAGKTCCKRHSVSEDKSYRGNEAGKVREGVTRVWLE